MLRYLLSIPMVLLACPAMAQTALDTTAPAPVANTPANDDDKREGGVTGLVAIGGGFLPKYEGSDKYKASPFGLVALKWKGIEFNLIGTELQVDFGGGGHFLFGPVIGLANSRSVKNTEGAISQLDPIGDSANVGAFAGFRFGGNARGQGRLVLSAEALKDTKSEKGLTVQTGVRYAAIRSKRVFATLTLAATFNDAKYQRTFFGVTDAEAARSGLEAFSPGGGLTKVSAGVTAGYQLTRHWGVLGRVQGSSFAGDAADSPIAKAGSKRSVGALLGISYTF